MFAVLLSEQVFVVLCADAADKLRADTGGKHGGLADAVVLKAHGHGDLFKVHTDKGKADVKSGVCPYLLKGDGLGKGGVGGGGERAACLGLGNDVYEFPCRNGGTFGDYGAVEVLTALGGKENALCLQSIVNAAENGICGIGRGVGADAAAEDLAGGTADYEYLSGGKVGLFDYLFCGKSGFVIEGVEHIFASCLWTLQWT